MTEERYISDLANNRVQIFNSSGEYVSQFGSEGSGNSQFNAPFGIAVDGVGNIYVADSGNCRVQIFNSSRVYQSQFGSCGSGNGQFQLPNYIALDSFGYIYVGDRNARNVQVFSPNVSLPPPASTPEPSSLVGLGLLGVGLILTARKRAKVKFAKGGDIADY